MSETLAARGTGLPSSEILRGHSRRANFQLTDVAAAVVDGHRLLPKQPDIP